ncbi:lytic polysaccharide monooxygenase [Neisseriaceae bacterium JH1-16]|nr:lytic polysaccharide monooxygenase [Neisseriaceae bacterium JH1-16]
MKSLAIPVLGFGLFTPLLAQAHGSMEVPVSRIYNCFKEGPESPKSAACREAVRVGGPQALYDWNGVNQLPNGNHQAFVPDGQLCGGGKELYKGMNLARSDWVTSPIAPNAAGNFEFIFHATAPHATRYWRLYVTKNGWNPSAPIKWSDLEQFAEIGNVPVGPDQRYRLTAPLPKGKSGQHVIYAVWQRSDSAEAFYSCSDVKFGDSGTAPAATSWKEVDQVRAQQDLPAGTKVTLRVFNAQGGDAASYSVTLTAANASAQLWPAALARQVNANSTFVKVGVLGSSGAVAPVDDSMGNRIYLSSAYPKYTTQIDTTLPSTSSGATEWREGVAYTVGQIVSYQGKRYKCLQAHTAWTGANWNPASSTTLWKVAS